MRTAYEDKEARERAYRAECIKRGSELLTARDAAVLFGVNESAIHVAKNEGRLRPFFVLAHRDTPLYWLVTLREYFAGRAEPHAELLEKMRSHGLTCWVSNSDGISGGGWVLLSEKPGLRSWNEADGD